MVSKRRHLLAGLLLLLPLASALRADITTVYDFEGGTQGFQGNTAVSKVWASSGSYSLAIDATGSAGWNQNLAVESQNEDWSDAVEFLADVYLPAGTKAAAGYVQFIPTFSGPRDNFYQLGKADLVDGVNHVAMKVNGSKVGTPWKLYLIFNSDKAIPGKIYVDNIRMRKPGRPGRLTVSVVDPYGRPIAGVVIGAGTVAETTDALGQAVLALPSDHYDAEVLGADVVATQFKADVPVGDGKQTVTVSYTPRVAPIAARVWVQAGSRLRSFDAGMVYGHNMAMWSGLDPFTNPLEKQRLHDIRTRLIRIPGGEYGNQWNWRTGGIYKQDESMALDWSPEANWDVWKKFFHDMGPNCEAMLILNVFQSTPEEQVAWIHDAIDSGIKVPYVELGNEPDLDPKRFFGGRVGGSTDIATYVRVVTPFARAVRQAFPNIKILGPVVAQIDDPECPGQHPWECNHYDAKGNVIDDPNHPNWVKKFLRLYAKQGDLLDGVSVHSYPYYPRWLGQSTDVWDPTQAFSKVPKLLPYLRDYRRWMARYYSPAKAAGMVMAMTEFNMQVPETWVTADVEDAVWNADYLGQFLLGGGTVGCDWDINTLKPADGGGHGMIDPDNDPTRPYAQRARFWMYKMLASNFTGNLVRTTSSSPLVSAYASQDRGRVAVLLINRDPARPASVTLQVQGADSASQLRVMSLSHKTYLWSKVLYRAVLNLDPTVKPQLKVYGAPAENQGWRVYTQRLEPMSVTLAVFDPPY